jgi:hypothetical protein
MQLKNGEKLDMLRTTPNLHIYDLDDIEATIETWLIDKERVIMHDHYRIKCFTYIYLSQY